MNCDGKLGREFQKHKMELNVEDGRKSIAEVCTALASSIHHLQQYEDDFSGREEQLRSENQRLRRQLTECEDRCDHLQRKLLTQEQVEENRLGDREKQPVEQPVPTVPNGVNNTPVDTGPITYILEEDGSQKGSAKLFAAGYTYVKRNDKISRERAERSENIKYICSVRSKSLRCPGTVTFHKGVYTPGTEHIKHRIDYWAHKKFKIQKQVNEKSKEQKYRGLPTVVSEVMREHWNQEEPSEFRPKDKNVRQKANYQKHHHSAVPPHTLKELETSESKQARSHPVEDPQAKNIETQLKKIKIEKDVKESTPLKSSQKHQEDAKIEEKDNRIKTEPPETSLPEVHYKSLASHPVVVLGTMPTNLLTTYMTCIPMSNLCEGDSKSDSEIPSDAANTSCNVRKSILEARIDVNNCDDHSAHINIFSGKENKSISVIKK